MRHLIAFVVAVLGFLSPLASGQASIEDLAWIAGKWKGQLGSSSIEEQWSEPEAGGLMGMFRLVSAGQTRLLEFMTIESEESGIALYLRHFSPGLEAREDNALRFGLISQTENEATFETMETAGKTRLLYRMEPDNGLTVVLEKDRDGKTSSQTFHYTRK